jgi:CO dehydrogenase maturation factor
MSDIILIGGKGGVGKTTVAAFLTLELARRKKGGVLAIDADPNSNLAEALGAGDVKTIADVIDDVAAHPEKVPPSMGKDAFIEYRIHQDILEKDGFDLCLMGRPEGPGCYCYINNVLRNVLEKLTKDYAYVVIDNEAGLEHFSRKTARRCTHLILVADETPVGLRTAQRILGLIEGLGIRAEHRSLIVNGARAPLKTDPLRSRMGLDAVFVLPYDEAIRRASVQGESVLDLPAEGPIKAAVARCGEVLWPRT